LISAPKYKVTPLAEGKLFTRPYGLQNYACYIILLVTEIICNVTVPEAVNGQTPSINDTVEASVWRRSQMSLFKPQGATLITKNATAAAQDEGWRYKFWL
jgi:hypothetical protein